jgi:hypothetical protein
LVGPELFILWTNFSGTEFSEVGAREEGPGCSGPSSSQRFGLGALSDVARVVVNDSRARASSIRAPHLAHVLDHRSVHDARVVVDGSVARRQPGMHAAGVVVDNGRSHDARLVGVLCPHPARIRRGGRPSPASSAPSAPLPPSRPRRRAPPQATRRRVEVSCRLLLLDVPPLVPASRFLLPLPL